MLHVYFRTMKWLICSAFVLLFVVSFVYADCGVVTKKQWGGLSPTHVEYLPRPVDLVIIQHTVTPTCETDQSCEERVANIQGFHMDSLNFWDIGPSFLIGGNGKVYEGSGWLHVGAHTYGYNRKSIGITFIGDFNKDDPNSDAVNAAKALIKCGVDEGHLKSDYKVVAHRQLASTESPGRKLYQEIRKWPDWVEDVSSIKN
ncbi:peptidoglycan recognition protein-like [Hyposmocoma kahamanoa]|uniref:peptidoglycan recognition protein-like n=1 Tax=Hyposmocoma kahamanoa TaxID=1477025 RepID=UPI000E6D8F5D|nr:peptidoglycan recognition protein-like [Hyposmocoma kahamanoa]